MDAFYASIEIRDNPDLAGKPVAVGGTSGRGVLTTCNYVARTFGCRSAMPTYKALRLCPDLVLVPVRFDAYRAESQRIRAIFSQFTGLVEPLSLDEAYLDVSHLRSLGAAVASEIRHRIRAETGLTASAGIAPNKALAKIASDWNKPDGQFEVAPDAVDAFVRPLPLGKLWGVGKVTRERLAALGFLTCGDLQSASEAELASTFGKWGCALYRLSRGIDERPVSPDRTRKSLSSERTFAEDLGFPEQGRSALAPLVEELQAELREKHRDRVPCKIFVKLKFSDFTQTTIERAAPWPESALAFSLLEEAWPRGNGKPVRLLGVGVRFAESSEDPDAQLEMFA